jgi:hypothetical protein
MSRFGEMAQVQEVFATSTTLPFLKFKVTDITPDFLIMYSFIAIGVTTVFGSLLIGLIQEGSETAGLKFIPILFPLGQSVFFVSRIALTTMFGGLVVT